MRVVMLVILLTGILVLSSIPTLGNLIENSASGQSTTATSSAASSISSISSWNPHVNCSPEIITISQITDNRTGMASYSNSLFSPGITSPAGQAKRWLTNASGDRLPSGWIPPGPPCTIKNSKGETVASFVQLDGIALAGLLNEQDCSTKYDLVNGGSALPHGAVYCTYSFNAFDPNVVPVAKYGNSTCTTPNDPTCYARIHVDIDLDWLAAGYCGAGTVCDNTSLSSYKFGTLFDIQGFIYWDPLFLNESWHSFSGWEIHPLTAWKLAPSSNNSKLSSDGQISNKTTLPFAYYAGIAAIIVVAGAASAFFLVRKKNSRLS